MSTREIRAWRKRFRGSPRYYRNLRREAASFSFPFKETDWYDLHHHHFDFWGHGRRGFKHRREHLSALFVAYRRVLTQARTAAPWPVQVFVSISPDCWPEGDAAYVHTANPNGTPFPYAFPGVEWGVTAPVALREFVAGEPWEIGVKEEDGNRWFVVRERLSR